MFDVTRLQPASRVVSVDGAGGDVPGVAAGGGSAAARQQAGTPADEVLAVLGRAGGELAAAVTDCRAWSGPQRSAVLRALDLLGGSLAATRARLLVAEQQAGTTVRPGDRDFTAARARVTRTGYGQAAREVAQATTLVSLPAVADAVQAGRVPLAHVDALARVSAGASAQGAAALASAEGQAAVVGLAERLPVKDFASRVAQLVAAQDPAGLERDAAHQRAERFLHLSHQPDGTYLRGRLDRVAGEILRGALASTGHAPDETRDKAQADADALVALAQRAASGMAGVRARRTDSTGTRVLADPEQDEADTRVSGAAARPHLTLLVPAETFAEVRAHVQAQAASGDGPQVSPATVEHAAPAPAPAPAAATVQHGTPAPATVQHGTSVAPATLEDGTPVALSQLARALCDCEISRVVLTSGSVPVDLGRTQRLYPATHRRAVIVRDRHCAWNGCEVPAAFCEVHHIRWWGRDRGATSLDNAVLLCDHHHQTVHSLDLTVERHVPSVPSDGPRRPERPRLAVPDDPVRYTFRHRDGRLASAPRAAASRRRRCG